MSRIYAAFLISITTLLFSCKDEVTNGGITSCDFPSFVDLADSCIVAIPNMFTPNGDGVNDEFSVIFDNNGASPLEDLHITIQNEAATTLAEGFDTDFAWDGEAGGSVNFGVYIVTVDMTIDAQPYTFESYLYCLPYNTADFDAIDCIDCRFANQWDGNSFDETIDHSEPVCN